MLTEYKRRDGKGGYLLPPGTPQSFIDKIEAEGFEEVERDPVQEFEDACYMAARKLGAMVADYENKQLDEILGDGNNSPT